MKEWDLPEGLNGDLESMITAESAMHYWTRTYQQRHKAFWDKARCVLQLDASRYTFDYNTKKITLADVSCPDEEQDNEEVSE